MPFDELIVRFPPSPTGHLHIGSAKIALINYLYAKQNGGKLLIRIEDTDKARSSEEFTKSIFEGLKWLGITYDDEPVIQSSRLDRHKEIALDLLKNDKAYYCFCSQQELAEMRESQDIPRYNKKCRNLTHEQIDELIKIIKPTIRLKVPEEDSYVEIDDLILEHSKVHYDQLDDFIILKSDSSPTYMLSVVVDDHDYKISHILRGSDHFTNTFRQIMLYQLCGWDIPIFGHIPLMCGDDGKKLSKRHGATSLTDYSKLGYLPESIKIYLTTMHDTKNIHKCNSFDDVLKTFDIKKISKSMPKFDINFLNIINQNQMMLSDKHFIASLICDELCKTFEDLIDVSIILSQYAYTDIVSRSKNIIECANLASIYYKSEFDPSKHTDLDISLFLHLAKITLCDYTSLDSLKKSIGSYIKDNKLVPKQIFDGLRIILTGRDNCPPLYNLMMAIGNEEVARRINTAWATV